MDDRAPTSLQSSLDQLAPLGRSGLLPAIHAAQAAYGYIAAPTAEAIGLALGVPLSDVHGVIEFYSLFYNQPVGECILRVCTDPSWPPFEFVDERDGQIQGFDVDLARLLAARLAPGTEVAARIVP